MNACISILFLVSETHIVHPDWARRDASQWPMDGQKVSW